MSLAWITGASRGIGRATALTLAQRGLDLVLFGRPSPELEQAAAQAREHVRSVTLASCDLSASEQVVQAAQQALERHGTPDVLINNAGMVRRVAIEQTTNADWDEQLAVNLRAPFLLTRAVLPGMRARKSGRILHVASISATLGSPNAAAYAASKWGLVGFMKSLAEELHDSGVTTLAVLPGSVATRMLAGSGFEARMTAEDVARTLVFYALEASGAHNGGTIEMFGT